MLKKILIAIIAICSFSAVAMARGVYSRDESVLPKAAQTVISNNFKAKVSVIKMDNSLGRTSKYEVILTDGSEITFDRDGNWQEVETGIKGKVPEGFIPKSVADYVKKNQPGQKIVGIEKEHYGYDVELSNGVEMKFNRQGAFIRYDK